MPVGDTIKDIAVKRCPECGARFAETAGFCPFDGASLAIGILDPTRDPLVGKCLEDRYEVERLIGEGGMGSVYQVRHTTLDRRFALKALKHELANEDALAERFLREARATAAIKHPGVVQITDFGKLKTGEPFFVMELLEGETLATRIRARGPMSPRNVVGIAKQICDALEATHAAGVIHRDLKPENVFLVGKTEDIRIVDFGAAKVMGSSKMTRPGVVFGTPYYMSPEQASGVEVDARADVYSLGVLMYEMITGSVPFEADTYMGVLTKHMFAEPTKPSAVVASGVMLGDLEAVIMRCLLKDPPSRYPSMRDLSAALETALERRASEGPPRERRPAPQLTTADRIERSVARRVGEERRRIVQRIAVIVAGVISVGLFVTAIVLWLQPPRASKARPELQAVVAPAAPPPPAPRSAAIEREVVREVAPPPPASSPAPSISVSVAPVVSPPPVFVAPPKKPPTPPPSTPSAKPLPRNDESFVDPWAK